MYSHSHHAQFYTRDTKKYVKVPLSLSQTAEKTIEVGLRGSDGRTEILGGLEEGETIVTFEQKK